MDVSALLIYFNKLFMFHRYLMVLGYYSPLLAIYLTEIDLKLLAIGYFNQLSLEPITVLFLFIILYIFRQILQ